MQVRVPIDRDRLRVLAEANGLRLRADELDLLLPEVEKMFAEFEKLKELQLDGIDPFLAASGHIQP